MKTKLIKAYGTGAANAPLHPLTISRRELQPHDAEIEILYCGICHSDLHAIGGFSESIVVDENYVLHVPEKLDLASAAPILCAGITVYSPLKHWNAGPGKKVGIIGIGGLGHMAIKIAKAMGAHVVVFSTSISKVNDAKRTSFRSELLT